MAGPAIVHIEFKSSDFARTSDFYAKLFDWQTAQNASGSYMKMDSSDGPSGGWVRADLVQSPGPIAYLVVDDLEGEDGRVDKRADGCWFAACRSRAAARSGCSPIRTATCWGCGTGRARAAARRPRLLPARRRPPRPPPPASREQAEEEEVRSVATPSVD
jgi:hypothetical protein